MSSTADPQAKANWQLPGYTVIETLYRGAQTTVFRCLDVETQQTVAIKVLSEEYPSFEQLVQFRNQYTIAKDLPSSGVVRPLSLKRCGNSYCLVMEDPGCLSLQHFIQQQPLRWPEILEIAIQLAETLHELHQHRVIHKDIKPANILIHPESRQVWLTDFSIASLLPKESQRLQSPKSLEGTLAYLAPEQTGRMNRGIDYRTDFYNLGVSLYQLLTGELPFQTVDPLELIHCHMAQQAPELEQVTPDVPVMVAAIVRKLMGKNAEERYQSALGLKHDLEECLTQWKEHGEVRQFELGQRDVSNRFIIPEKLYGRNAEVGCLLGAFDRVAAGAAELMLVAGFSGIGKTAVVNEIHKPIVRQKGYFIKGKFEQFKRNIPFSALLQACQDLIAQLLSESDAELQIWRAKIVEALGDNAQVIVELMPSLERIIGTPPIAQELTGVAAQNRFNLLMQRFIRVFTCADHPLTLFVDDLQWADAASLNLIKLLLAQPQAEYLLIVGAYRDNEVSTAHPLKQLIRDIKKTQVRVHALTLMPLNYDSIGNLIADTLHAPEQAVSPLTELVLRKTKGNPFFATQFLKTLHEEQLISFDAVSGYWKQIVGERRETPLSNDVVEFIASQLQKLPDRTQEILKLAACIGGQFDLATLTIVSEQSRQEVASALWTALQAGSILPTSDLYKFYQGEVNVDENVEGGNPSYRFLHDRVQQAAYCLIPDDRKRAVHLKIGRLFLQQLSPQEQDDKVFDIANQLNCSIDSIADLDELKQIAYLNLKAAQKARAATANLAVLEYTGYGIAILSDTSWESSYDLVFDLHFLATESCYLIGDYDRMEELANIALQRATTVLDRARILEIKLSSFIAQKKFDCALSLGIETLSALGINFPVEPNESDIQQLLEQTQSLIPDAGVAHLRTLPTMVDPQSLTAMRIMNALVPPIYQTRSDLVIPIFLLPVQTSILKGNSELSSFFYICYATILCSTLDNIDMGVAFSDLAIDLLSQFPSKAFHSRAYIMAAVGTIQWKSHIKGAVLAGQLGIETGWESGDLENTAWNYFYRSQAAYFVGENLADLSKQLHEDSEAIKTTRQMLQFEYHEIYRQAVLNLIGESQDACVLVGEAMDENQLILDYQSKSIMQGSFCIFMHKTILAYLFGQYAQALEFSETANQYAAGVVGQIVIPVFHFYRSLAIAALHREQTTTPPSPMWETFDYDRSRLRFWASHAPMNFGHKSDLLQAEYSRIQGQQTLAADLYDRAVAGAKEHGFIQEEALANELAAKFYLEQGRDKIAKVYMQDAYYCYARWGAEAKIEHLEACYPNLLTAVMEQPSPSDGMLNTLMTIAAPTFSAHSNSRPNTSNSGTNETFDFASVLKASQVLASTIQLDELLHQLSQIILQNSGADRCALILPDETGEWQVRAIATPDNTQLSREPLANNPNLPIKLIQYVKNAREVVVVDELKTDRPVVGDYLRQRQPKSVLCLPILNQGHLIGLLYLKNRLTRGVFTDERILILNFLCTQAAISLENARLYSLEQRKNQQLAELNHQLSLTEFSVERSSEGIIWLTQDGRIVNANQSACKMLDYPLDELTALSLTDIGMPTCPNAEKHCWKQLKEQGYLFLETRYRAKDGRVFPVEVSSNFVDFDNQEYCISIIRDISERKKLEQEQEQLTAVLEATPDYIGIANSKGELLWHNKPLRELQKDSEERYKHKTISNCHPDWVNEIILREAIPHAIEYGSWTGELAVLDSEGNEIPVSQVIIAHKSESGEIENFSTVMRDIRDRKAAEQALQDSESRFRRMTDNVPGMIYRYVLHPDGRDELLYISSQVKEIFNLEVEEALLDVAKLWSKIHLDDLESVEEVFQTSAESLEPFLCEFRIHDKTGIRWIQTTARPEKMSNGDIVWDGVASDISDRKRAEERLETTNAELVRATRMKDEFLATMSHELRTPLNAILGMTECLKEEVFGAVNDEQLKSLSTIDRSGNHLLGLINDILDLSKIAAGKIEIIKSPCDITSLCYSSLQLIQQQAQSNKIQIQTSIPANLPLQTVDEQRLGQVLLNLLSNAVKFTPEGGQVTLSVYPKSVPDPTGVLEHGYIRLAVSDTGIGIAPEHIGQLFQPFVQIDSALNRQFAGTGLGLALVKQIVELHGGRVMVSSEVDVGSTFTVDIPWTSLEPSEILDRSVEEVIAEEPEIESAPLILLVEDDAANIMTTYSYLKAKGYRLAFAENGQEAVELVQTLKPSLVLMDIQMPVMDGLVATEKIRKELQQTELPIVALTALAMKGDRERCLQVGATEYLSKPVKLKQLDELLQKYLKTA